MKGELDRIRACMADHLTGQGVQAVTAWPDGSFEHWRTGPVAAVSLRECKAVGSGLGDYLGERYDEGSGQWQELFGKRLEIRLGLDLYAAGEDAAERLQTAFDRLAGVLHEGGPVGLKIKGFSCGETDYDRESRLFHRPVEVECMAYLYAVAEEGGAFLDYEIRGEWKR